MRDGLLPSVGQRQRFAATIDRIGVKDEWRSAITVLLKDVELVPGGAGEVLLRILRPRRRAGGSVEES